MRMIQRWTRAVVHENGAKPFLNRHTSVPHDTTTDFVWNPCPSFGLKLVENHH
jgi:hypothetical protein